MYMFRVFIGFVSGVYVGTYYNCKPLIEKMRECFKNNFPEEKEKKEEKVDNQDEKKTFLGLFKNF